MMRIGELAQHCATTVETLRFYERAGLLPAPARSSGNFRLYDERAVARIGFIRHCRTLDMTLDEIRALLRLLDAPQESCAEVNAILDAHIGHVAQRIAGLRQLKKDLQHLRDRCTGVVPAAECAILDGLGQGAPWRDGAGGSSHHPPGTHAPRKSGPPPGDC